MIPIKAEIGATAKANLDIKGEVSTPALDRIAHAFADAISPFTERRGLKGDILRLQRQEITLQIAEQARRKIENEGLEVKAIPNKVLVPLLEKASLEDQDSALIEWWVSLLASTSIDAGMQHPIFSELISKITVEEAEFLDYLVTNHFKTSTITLADVKIEKALQTDVAMALKRFLDSEAYKRLAPTFESASKNQQSAYFQECHRLLNLYKDLLRMSGIIIVNLSYDVAEFHFAEDVGSFSSGDQSKGERVLDVLVAIGLMRRQTIRSPMPADFIGEFSATVDTFQLTTVGRRLLMACRRSRSYSAG